MPTPVRSVLVVSAIVVITTKLGLLTQAQITGFENLFSVERGHYRNKYRPIYHITSPMGWLNDPSGFVKFRNQYHIFYLYHPYSGAWGHITWGHVVSENLIDWTHLPPAIAPREYYEKHGCLSGSALIHNNYLTIFYTGNVILNNSSLKHQSQNIAISSDGIIFQKYLYNPIIKDSPYMDVRDFRNPKVWRFRNLWYMLVGVMTPRQHGQILLYNSNDMFHWQLNGTIAQSYGDMGYVWENPDFFEIDGLHVLMFCARGIQTEGYNFRNLYQSGYLIGTFNYLTAKFDDGFEVSTATYNTLDHGHDFYAPQTFSDGEGRRFLIAWLGMSDNNFEESVQGMASMLTLVRELSLNSQGRLCMLPVRELVNLRKELLEDAWYSPDETFNAGTKAFELLVNSTKSANHAMISFEWAQGKRFSIEYNAQQGYVSINRGGDDGVRRTSWAPPGDVVYWRIFVDHSSVEVFCGNGEVVFSSRIYPRRGIRIKVKGDTALYMQQYKLRRAVGQWRMPQPSVEFFKRQQHPRNERKPRVSSRSTPRSLSRRRKYDERIQLENVVDYDNTILK